MIHSQFMSLVSLFVVSLNVRGNKSYMGNNNKMFAYLNMLHPIRLCNKYAKILRYMTWVYFLEYFLQNDLRNISLRIIITYLQTDFYLLSIFILIKIQLSILIFSLTTIFWSTYLWMAQITKENISFYGW